MRAFARACLELTELRRLALAVLDGGVFAPRRALELAKIVCDAMGAWRFFLNSNTGRRASLASAAAAGIAMNEREFGTETD